VDQATRGWERYQLQEALQRAGVPAGVCQNAEDRFEYDPQLKHLEWMTELRHSEMGVWPIKEFPARLSETPAYMGGIIDRHGPCYGEDNEYVLGKVLGFSAREIAELREQGVL
jgi:crotonobetainyl-CoA:carnitine CoA-transferase CaiB-like acyl-CoA transferase